MKWYLGTVKGIRAPKHASAQLGTDVHALLEHFKRTGRWPYAEDTREKRIAAKALPLLPVSTNVLLEQNLYLPRDTFGYRGIADIVRIDEQQIDDHKTSSNPKRYGLKEKTLPFDTQANIYAGSAFALYEWESVGLQWNYIPTSDDDAPAYPVRGRISREHCDNQLVKIDAKADKLLHAKSLPIEKIRTNAEACHKYGGCGYRNVCPINRSTSTLMGALKESERTDMPVDQSVMQRIREKAQGAGSAATAQAATPQAQGGQSALDAMKAKLAAKNAAPAQQQAAPETATPSQASAQPTALEAMKAKLAAKNGQPTQAQQQARQEATAPEPEPEPAAEPAALPKAESQPMQKGYMATAKANDAAAAVAAAGEVIGTLYIGCLPVGDPNVINANDLIAQANAIVCEEQTVPHYKQVEYGKGPGMLAVALAQVIAELPKSTSVFAYQVAEPEALSMLQLCATRIVVAL